MSPDLAKGLSSWEPLVCLSVQWNIQTLCGMQDSLLLGRTPPTPVTSQAPTDNSRSALVTTTLTFPLHSQNTTWEKRSHC